MAEETPEEDEALEAGQEKAPPGNVLARLRAWAAEGGRRNTLVLAGLGAIAVITVGSWLMVADFAAQTDTATIEMALEALDDGDDDLAAAIVQQIQESNSIESVELGGPLFVLGALKEREADRQWSTERKRNDHLIASKYLGEARVIGWPDGREGQGLYLLGKSLINSHQIKRGLESLQDALAVGVENAPEVHFLLAEAYFFSPSPDYRKVIEQADMATEASEPGEPLHADSLLLRAESLAALGEVEGAIKAVELAEGATNPARRRLVEGKALTALLEKTLGGARPSKPERAPQAARDIAERATAALERARRLDKLATPITRQSDYLKARVDELIGNSEVALQEYSELRRNQGSSPAGIAAAMAEGDLHQLRNENVEALESYRRALEAVDRPSAYQSGLLPLEEFRKRVLTAHSHFLDSERFDIANQLANRVTPLLSRMDQLMLRADGLRMWGESLIVRAETMPNPENEYSVKGRLHLREAGMAYEELAEARFATNRFVDDLWVSADSYFLGQSYSSAARVLERYLRHEPELRNAMALLRLGESCLAMGDDNAAIHAFEECLEFHPNDAASYWARMECAKAYSTQNNPDKAEELLKYNLLESDLTPFSPEWRNSKFELGRLLADNGKHQEAIEQLEEAVDRYPDDPQNRLARYLIAEAYRHSAEEPLSRYNAAKTVNERERSREEARAFLREALDGYQKVQREITVADSTDNLDRAMLRNCYMLAGDVQFELEEYEDAIKSYSNVSTYYQNEPFVLETLVQISHCWRRLKDNVRASGAIQQAKSLLARLPPDADFATSTNLTRLEWGQLLDNLAQL